MTARESPTNTFQMLYESGVITTGEFALLDRFFTRMTQRLKVDLIV